ALCIARRLRMPWRLLVVLRLVPRRIRDWGYDLIARNRYRWFGQRNHCWLPNEAYANRFIE
ncbi:MAG TPA: DCC1-like thiol-disulfide oxidoreductase family protein, partial [Cellvibrionaceae bacterium]|nr:DCC1-like thiol-disulfide oxidoreductase family protein [Cellvibrionaceae bacterium]